MSFLHKHYRRSIKSLVRRSFPLLQRFGIHITLNLFYYPIPDTRTLSNEIWNRKSELPGINMAEPAQLELLRQFASEFRSEYDALPMDSAGGENHFHVGNRSFGRIDAEALYGMIRHFKPGR